MRPFSSVLVVVECKKGGCEDVNFEPLKGILGWRRSGSCVRNHIQRGV